ncbi:helix-turn-helix domain-containing protein [Actinokineospora sp.]|uniref:helix-turn-helix domain-containing protein n=1 Tax=Actinokineospora sp. TaxID=1872133 RepID=UPI004037DEF8
MGARQTVERRQLGLSLKRHRVSQGRSQHDVADLLGHLDARISKVEDGSATLSVEELDTVLDYLNVHGPERATLLELGAQARKRSRRGAKEAHAYTDTLPGSFQRLADMEADATSIYLYEPGVIPGPLQTPGYIRAVIQSCDGVFWERSDAAVESRIAFRRERQIKVLESARPKDLQFVFTEDALTISDDEVEADLVREQCDHLLYLGRLYPGIRFQVIRSGWMRSPSPNGGMTLLDFAGAAPRVAFTQGAYGPSTYFDEEPDVAALLRAFRKLQELALDHRATVDVIRRKLQE